MKIASVASALPVHRYEQRELAAYLEGVWSGKPELARRIDAIHENVQVETRHLAYPLERYASLRTFGEFNDAWIAAATDLSERAARLALERAGLTPQDVDMVIFSTVTGVASPSIDAKLANRLGFRPDVKRMPLFGLGCVAGASAVSRAADFVRGSPRGVVLVLAVELCSLTLQRGDTSLANVIASGLFGDGASCAIVVGAERAVELERAASRTPERTLGPTDHPPASRQASDVSPGTDRRLGPRIVDTRSVFYPDTEDVMGWSISEHGFRIVLSPAVPVVARERLGPDVDTFLADHRLTRADIASWVCHPGGPKVLAAARDSLGITDDDLSLSWESLRAVGNLSSASVLLILEQTMLRKRPRAGSRGVMLAMGPGFCSELLLLEW